MNNAETSDCPRCKSYLRRAVVVTMDIPAFLTRVNKSTVHLKDARITGAMWDKSFVYCAVCGWNQNTPNE